MYKTLLTKQNFSSALRAYAMLMKFVIVFYLAGKLQLRDFGIFNLFMAGTQLAAAFIPLDVYSVTIRRLLNKERNVLDQHFGFLLVSIATLLPLGAIIFNYSSINLTTFISLMFLIISALDIVFTESTRIFPALNRPLTPSVLLFFKTSLLTIPTILLFEFELANPNLTTVLYVWFISSLIACIISWILLRASVSTLSIKFNLDWSIQAIKLSSLFFLSTILFRSILGVDKFIVENALGVELLAVYSLYFSIAFSSVSLIEAGISSWSYPKLTKLVQKNAVYETNIFFKDYVIKNSISSLALFIPIILIFSLLTYTYLDQIYKENLKSFYIICIGVFAYCLSIPFHYYIYALQKDIIFVKIYLISFAIYVTFALMFIKTLGVLGAALMICIGLSSIAILRVIYSSKKC